MMLLVISRLSKWRRLVEQGCRDRIAVSRCPHRLRTWLSLNLLVTKRLGSWSKLWLHRIASLVVMLLIIRLLLLIVRVMMISTWLLLLVSQQVKHGRWWKSVSKRGLLLWIYPPDIGSGPPELFWNPSHSLWAWELSLKREGWRRSYFTLICHGVIYTGWLLLLHQELLGSWVALETATRSHPWGAIELIVLLGSGLIIHILRSGEKLVVSDACHH